MKPFEKTTIPESEWEKIGAALFERWKSGCMATKNLLKQFTHSEEPTLIREVIKTYLYRKAKDQVVWVNDEFQVSVVDRGEIVHLSIRRLDREAIHDWRKFQEIKNLLVGPGCEGVELYPAESRLVDTSNQYHLWVLKEAGVKLPFGFECERAVMEGSVAGSRQRPREKSQLP